MTHEDPMRPILKHLGRPANEVIVRSPRAPPELFPEQWRAAREAERGVERVGA